MASSILRWTVALYNWVVSEVDLLLLRNAPRLYWLGVVLLILGFGACFAILCVALAFLTPFFIAMALCRCLLCIIANLSAVAGGQEAVSEDATVSIVKKYRFQELNDINKKTSYGAVGKMVPVETSSCSCLAYEHLLLPPEDAECCICLNSYDDGEELRALPCNHHFHSSCILRWLVLKATCPLCNYSI